MVSFDDVQEFIKKLNESEQKRGGGYLYRLPSEEEWEYACRGGATSPDECSYHFYFDKPTNDLSSKQANFNGNEPFGKADKGPFLARPTRVGAYPPNKLGLCDMHGNVWQWPGSGLVLRGGGWFTGGAFCPAGYRSRAAPAGRHNFVGFRLAQVPRGQRTLDRTRPAALPFRQIDGGPLGHPIATIHEPGPVLGRSSGVSGQVAYP
jgi:formylglycine-generating enzyme required for sulfatase activity